jgi:hypothetical protein
MGTQDDDFWDRLSQTSWALSIGAIGAIGGGAGGGAAGFFIGGPPGAAIGLYSGAIAGAGAGVATGIYIGHQIHRAASGIELPSMTSSNNGGETSLPDSGMSVPVNGGGPNAKITYGKNAMEKFRKHVQQMRQLTGSKIGDVGSVEGQAQIKSVIEDIVRTGETRQIKWGGYKDALWSRKGNAIVIRQANGEFVTFLDGQKLTSPPLWRP